MKRYLSIIFFFLFLSLTYLCNAQQLIQYNLDVKEGNSFYYSHGVNSNNSINKWGYRPTKDIYYNFTIRSKTVRLSVASFMDAPYGACVTLFDVANNRSITTECFPQNNPENKYLEIDLLPPGYYAIIVEGAMENGYITTRIECTDPLEFNLGEKDSSFEYTHTQNTNEWTTGATNGVLYRISTKKKSNLKITNTTAFSSGSQISLLNETKTTTIATKDLPKNNSFDNYLLVKDLPVGIYYVISKGKNQEGVITTFIKGIFPTEYDLGAINENFDYSHTQNTDETTNEWNNKPTNDVMYKIEIPKQMNIRISNSTSLASGSCIGLLNSTKTQTIASKTFPKDNFLGNNEYVEIKNIQPGTYYIVSEGASENGVIVTHIRTYNSTLSDNANYVAIRTNLGDAAQTTLNEFHYFDGLGSFIQSVKQKMTPNGGDLVVTQEYDEFGRESNAWLPSPIQNNNGHHISLDRIKVNSKLFYADDSVFSKQIYETSPLNRITEQYGPGVAWYSASKSVKTAWLVNTSSGELSCTLYAVASGTSLQRKGLYAAGELFVTKTEGEDGHVSYTFTDKLGRTVLERVMNGTIMNDTYYIYDNYGNLCYVLPPSASDVLTTNNTWADNFEILMNYAFIYKYDGRNRCIKKKLPGSDPFEMRYDKADHLIFSQDGNQKLRKEWTFIFYDALDRQTVSGIWKSETVPTLDNAVVTNYTGSGSLGGYIVNLTSLPPVDLITVNYYNDYAFLNMAMSAKKDSLIFSDKGYDPQFANAKGFLTGTRIYRLDDPTKYTVSAIYYDHRGRAVQSRRSNHVGGYDNEYFVYTFTGKIKQRMIVHSGENKTTRVETYYYNYGSPTTNPSERLLDVKHKLSPNTAQTTLAVYSYDDIGRIKTKKLGSETSTYSYNVRSWLTQISGTKFNQTLTYNAAVNGVTPAKALYNGNISAMKWKSANDSIERGYKFTYDSLNRLTGAMYGEGASLASNLNRFNEVVTYNDKMGNIKTLIRRGKLNSGYGDMDNLTYTYTGNKLTKVLDAVTTSITYPSAFHFVDRANVDNEYTYDKNGNLTKDLNKNITSITYNALNLPNVITYSNNNTVTYVYDGSGSKLSVAYNSGSTTTKTEYVGNKVYMNGTLSMVLTEEGYATVSGTPVYYYYLKDHQGNNRVVINQAGTVQQVNHYYPFGGLFGEGVQTSNQPYKYNGKELDRFQNLDMYDYGARHYDATLGRWFTVDPMAEKYYSISPYVYCYNNPVRFIDPDGRQGISSVAKSAKYVKNPSKFVKMLRAAEAFLFGSTATVAYNHYVDGDISQEVFQTLTSPATSNVTDHKERERWQRGQDRKAKETLDRNQANIANSIEDNVTATTPSGDPQPKRPPKNTLGKIVIGSGLTGALVESYLDNINVDPNLNENNIEKAENKTYIEKASEDNSEESFLEKIINLFK